MAMYCEPLKGQVAVVTGGAGLLGSEHAIALLESGAVTAIADIDSAASEGLATKLEERYGEGSCLALRMDVTDQDSIRSAQESLLDRFGRIDILINNAAIDPKVKDDQMIEATRLEYFSDEDWQFQLDVGLTGAFLCCQIFGYWMAQNGGGVILNIASDLSILAPDQRIYRRDGVAEDRQPVKPVTYSVIKAGLIGLTRYLATYWADRNVRVNALSPGGIYVNQPEDFVKRLSNLIPMGRMARRDEYRGAIKFLCSDASSYMTGQNIVMDGGRSVW